MYLPAHFAESRPQVLRDFIAAHPLGLLVTQNRAGGIDANSVPFFLDAGDDGTAGVLRAHVARANPLWKEARDDVDALVVFQGPQGYVSPAWYPSKAEHGKVVPTWNYVMVQARGRLRAVDDKAWLRAFVTRLTDHHEGAQPGLVVDRAQPTARLHHHVVPGRHDLAVFRLARVPGGRDIAVRPLEDDERIDVVARLLPERVRARDVGAQHAGRSLVAGVEKERNAVGVDAAGAVLRHQQPERVDGDEVAQHLRTRFCEMSGKVHRRQRGSETSVCRRLPLITRGDAVLANLER